MDRGLYHERPCLALLAAAQRRQTPGARQRDAAGPGEDESEDHRGQGEQHRNETGRETRVEAEPITDRTTTPIGSHSESFSVRIMRIELTTVSREVTPPGSIRRPQGRPLGTRAGHPKTRAPPAGIVTLSDLTATWILV